MRTSSTWNRVIYIFMPGLVVFLIGISLFAQPIEDPPLKVMKMGLGGGTVTSADGLINCGSDCDENYAGGASVSLTAMPDGTSTFAGWDTDVDGDTTTTPDCPGATNPCALTMNAAKSVRPRFDPATPIAPINVFDTTTSAPSTRVFGLTDRLAPNEVIRGEDIQAYISAHPDINTPAKFLAALLPEFKQNWILMTRSESLQTGIAELPRILLPSADARFVFSIGMSRHSSYPGADPSAIEYMQWDATQKNFRFHEIVLAPIAAMDTDGDGIGVIPARSQGVSIDDEKCGRCHSTRNILNLNRTVTPHVPGATVGTDGIPPGSVVTKNKPNWDAYDSWGGMMPFNRDRIYQGSVEAAAFRKLFNPWTWRTNDSVRLIFEQLRLQPPGLTVSADFINRRKGGDNDGHVNFAFDPAASRPVLNEPVPSSSGIGLEAPINTNYSFDNLPGSGPTSAVTRHGNFVLLRHTSDLTGTSLAVEGRGVQLFDLLGGLDGSLNGLRIADELINHHVATGNVGIDVRLIALAVSKLQPCLAVGPTGVISNPAITPALPPLSIDTSWFDARNGMSLNQVLADTTLRSQSNPRRKADIQKRDVDRSVDPYLAGDPPSPAVNGLVQQYGSTTSQGTDTSFPRVRQEVFRRPLDLGVGDSTVMSGIYVDREDYSFNTNRVALYRYLLEPFGVSVDKWSMGVRGRSRTYTFADVFSTYTRNAFEPEIVADLSPGGHPISGLTSFECSDLIPRLNTILGTPPAPAGAIPTYTDVQRIFNKSCIECHGGLDYPPYQNYGSLLDLSENENPPAGQDRLDRSHTLVSNAPFTTADPRTSFLYQRICPGAASLATPDTPCAVPATADNENCPFGIMPCGGPRLSHTDIATIRRWITGGKPNTRGDPHIETVDGVAYDFQSAGEFVLLRGQNFEVQARQTPVATAGPLGPNGHTGLSSCVSLNTAVAMRVGPHRITYEPNLNGRPDPQGLQLRVDGNLVQLTSEGIILDQGGRIVQTSAAGGVQVEAPGGSVIIVTPGWWPDYQVWYLNIDSRNVRATDGVMGVVPSGNWLPSLPDGTPMGPLPKDLHQRYVDLYDKFENAWRVTDATTLFDYAPGTSTATFAIPAWPEESPTRCPAPPQPLPGIPLERPQPRTLPLETAQQQCGAIVAANAKANCIQDVMATGEAKFAETYLRGQEIELRGVPDAPVLGYPEGFKLDVTGPVDFTWNQTTDKRGGPVTYRHCVWPVTERFTLHKCVITAAAQTPSFRGRAFYPGLIILIGLLLIALLIFLGLLRRRPWVIVVVAVVIVCFAIFLFYRGRGSQQLLAKEVQGLQSGKAYYWKVIAEDGKGGTVESETRRFQIK